MTSAQGLIKKCLTYWDIATPVSECGQPIEPQSVTAAAPAAAHA